MTNVINMKDAPPGWMSDPQYIYIGRAGKGQEGYWGNRYILRHEDNREKVLDLYRSWFNRQVLFESDFRIRLEKLRGKTLVCFCKPKACHGDIIAEYLDG